MGSGWWVTIEHPPVLRRLLKASLKRGALVAAANWPVTLIQAVADSLFKLLIAAPLLGGIFLVALVIGAEPGTLLTLDWRELVATIITSLRSRPLVLTAFLLALSVVIVGGSLFVFLVKGGTVGVLVRGEREGGAIELPPLHLDLVMRASRFSIELFSECAQALFPRYARLGFGLMAVYLASGAAYLLTVLATHAASRLLLAALITVGFVGWITLVNLLYLLMQIVIAADDCGVISAGARVLAFLRREWRIVAAVFAVVLALVIVATGASLLAAAALGLIAFVPLVWPAVLALQLMAWVLRGLVFQYIGLSSIGAYVKLYREFAAAHAEGRLGRTEITPQLPLHSRS